MIDISENIVCFFDGCCEPKNPGGNMGVGAVIFINGQQVDTFSDFFPAHVNNTNNVAEYYALQWILNWLKEAGLTEDVIKIYGDSQLVINQMNGQWKIKCGKYVQAALSCKECLTEFKNITLRWIPREENNYADELSKNHLTKKGVELKIQPV